MCKHAALEKQENQMVVKHRAGKPKSGISVFSGNSAASTLLSAFSFLSPFAAVVWILGVRQGLPSVAQAGLELVPLLQPQGWVPAQSARPRLRTSPPPRGGGGQGGGSRVAQARPELSKQPRLALNSHVFPRPPSPTAGLQADAAKPGSRVSFGLV